MSRRMLRVEDAMSEELEEAFVGALDVKVTHTNGAFVLTLDECVVIEFNTAEHRAVPEVTANIFDIVDD